MSGMTKKGATRRALVLAACVCATALLLTSASGAAVAAPANVVYGDISHKGLTDLGPAPTSWTLVLSLGLVYNQQGVANVVKSASDPSSSSYGKYVSLSTLQSKYGATSSVRKAVIGAFRNVGVKATVDVTYTRVTAKITIAKAQKLFGTKWDLYETGEQGQNVALPVDTPKLGSGLKGNVNVISGLGLYVEQQGSGGTALANPPQAMGQEVDGGTPTRTGTPDFGCATTSYPSAVSSTAGLFPNQILTAYGISDLHSNGLQGQGVRVAILGEAPTPTSDVTAFRDCFGFPGTSLTIHNGSGIAPILESSLDAMVLSMVAPKLSRLDLWVRPLGENDPQGALFLLADPLQATLNGLPLPNVISVSYGICEAEMKQYTAARTLFNRQLAATSALGITVVVAAGDAGSSTCAHGVSTSQLTSFDEQRSTSWPATSPYVLAAGGTNVTLDASNTIASSGVWNDTEYPQPYNLLAGGGGGTSSFESRPWWQPAIPGQSSQRMVPDVASFADASPGYAIICSQGVQGCGAASGQSIAFVGGTSAATPLTAGMIALWTQKAEQSGWPKPGFTPPLLYAIARNHPGAFLDITTGTNIIFDSVSCCTATTGYDMASGLGSPLADEVVEHLHH
jgi:subtilase family serine protease